MIEPRRATIPVTIDLPREIAELVVLHGPALLRALEAAVRVRHVVVAADATAKVETDARCDAQIAEWRKLAEECEAEMRRRSNNSRPSYAYRAALIAQLARERGMKPVDLERIIRVHGSSTRGAKRS